MTINLVPNWLRVILSILSFLSFIPQLRDIWTKKDASDISLKYILLILISATEQFTIGFLLVASHNQYSDVFVHDPRNAGDWLNLAQLTVVWIMSLVLFVLCLFYSQTRIRHKAGVVAVYISFLLISVAPTFHDAINPTVPCISTRAFTMGIFLAFWSQRKKASAMSTLGLATQAVVFSLVALSWTTRVRFIDFGGPDGPDWPDEVTLPMLRSLLITWYKLVGWAAVFNALFAIMQFVLLCIAKRQKRKIADSFSLREQEPLLGPSI